MKRIKEKLFKILAFCFLFVMFSCDQAGIIDNVKTKYADVTVVVVNADEFTGITYYEIEIIKDGKEKEESRAIDTESKFEFVMKGEITVNVRAMKNKSTLIAEGTATVKLNQAEVAVIITLVGESVSTVSAPIFSKAAGTYSVNDNVEVVITTETADAEIRYTLDGTTPTKESFLYENAIKLDEVKTYNIKAIAFKEGFDASKVVTAVYVISDKDVVQPVTFNPSEYVGLVKNFEGVVLTTATADAEIRYTINGSEPTESSELYEGKILLTPEIGKYTIKAIAFKEGSINSTMQEASYEFTAEDDDDDDEPDTVSKPVISFSGNTPYTVDTEITIVSTTSGSVIYYTTNGDEPAKTSTKYESAFKLAEGTYTVKAIAVKDGMENSEVAVTSEFTITKIDDEEEKVETPVITLSGSVPYTKDTMITITTATSGAAISYTLNGTSKNYTAPFSLAAGDYTIAAKAEKSGMLVSDEAALTFKITEPYVYNGTVIYVKSASAPSIWVWEVNGNAISALRGQSWPGDKMDAVTAAEMNDPSGWFKFEIPASELTGKDIQFKLNGQPEGNTPGTTLPGAKTGWLDNGTWTEKDPTQPAAPSKPVISVSPAGGNVKGDTTVSITISSAETITSKSAKIGSKDVTFSGNNAALKISDFINDKASGTLTVSAANAAGTETATFTFNRDDSTVVATSDFTWKNATVYFVMTDRFYDGDSSNNNSYGRPQMDATGKNIGTFHGGDLKGLTKKINDGYFDSIGVDALWITAPYEQARGWCGGGSGGDFAHYAYHGYYALDWTTVDKNMGTVSEMREFVTTAHKNGIRVILDIVMNHVGYATTKDMADFGYGTTTLVDWKPGSGQTWHSVHDSINYNDAGSWSKWWGAWVRAGIAGYTAPGNDDLTKNLAGLPDIRTELTSSVGLPPILQTKWAQEASGYDNWIVPAAKNLRKDLNVAPADYLVKWLAAWVEEFGIDGFRVDTAKHVEIHRWKQLKDASTQALKNWRNSSRSDNDPAKNWTDDFWMTGEHWNYNAGGGGGDYYGNGFNNMIDFGFQKSVPMDASSKINKWKEYAGKDGKLLPYISSHDTGSVFFNGDANRQITAGTALLLTPGPVQIYYGDEIGRDNGPNGSDADQGSRSSFQWTKVGNNINNHWGKIGQFRRNNPAVGAGSQTDLGDNTVGRVYKDNKVVIKVGASGSTSVNVGTIFTDGTAVRNAYTGDTGTVSGGKVTFTAQNGVVLIEAVK